MKTLQISNGEIRKGYELDDLSEDARNKVIEDHIKFLIETMDEDSPYFDAVKEAERMRTPWFLGSILWEKYEDEIIEDIEINNYLFDEDGDILPLTYHTKNNKIERISWKGNYNVEIL